MKRLLLAFVAATILLAACQSAPVETEQPQEDIVAEQPAPTPAPQSEITVSEPTSNDWEFGTPESQGVDSAMLAALHSAVAQSEEAIVWAIVTVRNGVIIDEFYGIERRGLFEIDEATPFTLMSVTKSFTGALIGIAIDLGYISGVDVKLSEFFPTIAAAEDGWENITLEHLLTHTSGMAWDEWGSGRMFHEMRRAENWVDFVLAQPMAATPGSIFNYNSGGSHLLAAILEQAIGRPAFDFAREHLFEPLGMDSVNWPTDPQGIISGDGDITMTARDAARFGQLMLNGGAWQGRQIISREWVEQSTTVQSAGAGDRTGQHGYKWWVRPVGEGNYDTFFALGAGGQHIFVVPELELVVVTVSFNTGDSYALWPYFIGYILPAVSW